MKRRWLKALVGALVVVGSGCELPRTELVVRVDSELAWGEGGRVQSVVVEVRRGGADGRLRSQRTTVLGVQPGRSRLPLHIGVRESVGDLDTSLWVEALGCAEPNGCTRETAVVAQRALVRFRAEETFELPLLLASACAGVPCSTAERCEPTMGMCRPASEATVRPFAGVGARSEDGGPSEPDVVTDRMETPLDAARLDAEVRDGPLVPDAALSDTGPRDAGAIDVPTDVPVDKGRVDVGPAEVGPPDVGSPDVGAPDVGRPDVGPPDVGPPDVGPPDVGPPDTGPVDAGNPTCPSGMVLFPRSEFDMGFAQGDADERPVHRVRLSAFCLDVTEVTVGAYAQCPSGRCSPAQTGGNCNTGVSGRGSHPVNCLTWAQARAYCQWRGGELPTESQWEYAARGAAGRTWPWGNSTPDTRMCWSQTMSRGSTCPVQSFPSGNSPEGIADLGGNVWEWTYDLRDFYPVGPVDDPTGGTTGNSHVFRGGARDSNLTIWPRASYRNYNVETFVHSTVGFRCAARVTP